MESGELRMPETAGERDRLERLAPDYDAKIDFDRFALDAFGVMLRSKVQGANVLDLGCSTGTTAEAIVDVVGTLDMVDGSEHYIEIARSRVGRANVRLYTALIEEYEPDRHYDHVLCSHILEHVVDPVAMLKQIRGWLAPGGRIWAYVPNARSIHRRVGVKIGAAESIYELSERDHMIGHRRVYDPDSFSKDIAAAGLRHGPLQGFLIKPFPSSVMTGIDERLIRGLLEVGAELPEISSDIYYECFE
jgi:2-polyprenyl-3-methyl-5-hydroxy-6-metoxy-1,4-benzoquinol methylase